MSIIDGLYLVLLAAVTGYVLMARVPSLLHTPMLSGSNFIHGIVLAGAMLALSNATGMLEMVIGFVAVTAASANVVGGFIVTDRMLNLFERKQMRKTEAAMPTTAAARPVKGSAHSTDDQNKDSENNENKSVERAKGVSGQPPDNLPDRRQDPTGR